jgi:hypothetical protein
MTGFFVSIPLALANGDREPASRVVANRLSSVVYFTVNDFSSFFFTATFFSCTYFGMPSLP